MTTVDSSVDLFWVLLGWLLAALFVFGWGDEDLNGKDK